VSTESVAGMGSVPGPAALNTQIKEPVLPFGVARERDLDGEFDPGSGRTLAARLTHASRT
jgi:hypothetical protein